jgi:hypothetical protein
MRGKWVWLRATGFALAVSALSSVAVLQNVVAADKIERTQAAEQLLTAALSAGQRKPFAKAIFEYCTQTSNHLPRNSAKEDEELAAAVTSWNVGRLQADPTSFSRYSLQKALRECAQNSKRILDHTHRPPAEAA